MSTSYRHFNVRLTNDQWNRVSALARAQGSTVAEVIRSAINSSLNAEAMTTSSARRMNRVAEYSHLVLDLIMREQFPRLRDRLIAETDRCLDQYHGA